jgi:hypothetical protein
VELKFAQETKIEDFALKQFSISTTIKVMKEAEKEKTEEAVKGEKKKKKKKKKKRR